MTNDKARALAVQIESSVNALATETDAVRKSGLFKQWLNAMATFSSYSFNNQMLIAFQRPSATRIAGFHTWRKLGRHVVKGAKGIAILAPCVYRKKAESDNDDSPTVNGSLVLKWPGFLRKKIPTANHSRLSPTLPPMAATNCSPASNGQLKNSASFSTTKKSENPASIAIPQAAASSFAQVSPRPRKPLSSSMS